MEIDIDISVNIWVYRYRYIKIDKLVYTYVHIKMPVCAKHINCGMEKTSLAYRNSNLIEIICNERLFIAISLRSP